MNEAIICLRPIFSIVYVATKVQNNLYSSPTLFHLFAWQAENSKRDNRDAALAMMIC